MRRKGIWQLLERGKKKKKKARNVNFHQNKNARGFRGEKCERGTLTGALKKSDEKGEGTSEKERCKWYEMKKGSERREGCLYRGNEKERALEG